MRRSLAFLLSCTAFISCAHAQNIARVDGVDIQATEVAIMEKELAATFAQVPQEQRKEAIVSYLIDLKLLSAAATKAKINENAEYLARTKLANERVLGEILLEQETKKAVSDANLKAAYDKEVKNAPKVQEVSARHILVEGEEEAKTILKQLNDGGDFAALAKEKSKDPGSKGAGGDLGYFTKDTMVPEFAEAAFKLEKGKLNDAPVKSQFGYHIIKVDDKRDKAKPTFDEIKPQLQQFLERQAQSKLIQDLRKDAKVELAEKPAAPIAPPVAAKP